MAEAAVLGGDGKYDGAPEDGMRALFRGDLLFFYWQYTTTMYLYKQSYNFESIKASYFRMENCTDEYAEYLDIDRKLKRR